MHNTMLSVNGLEGYTRQVQFLDLALDFQVLQLGMLSPKLQRKVTKQMPSKSLKQQRTLQAS